jgi:hypothetical protein
MVACDHNTFANELSLIAPIVEKKITARYAIALKIQARASRRMDWRKNAVISETEINAEIRKPIENPTLDKLISAIERIE